jgi:hypothetical protein
MIWQARGAIEMDVGRLDVTEGGEQRNHQRGGDKEYRAMDRK